LLLIPGTKTCSVRQIDLNLHYGDELEASTSNGIPSTLPTRAKGDSHLQSISSETDKAISNHDRSFLLPDLNMMPSDEGDTGTETL
jgi:hypothetical protein